MEPLTREGYLLLADISGYTGYLAGAELEHAHGVLTDLLEVIVRGVTPLLDVHKLEGDAVFAHAPSRRIPRGETLLEMIDETYARFRDRLESVRRGTTCTCNACALIPQLDLKFIAHHGSYIVQDVMGIRELVGSDVNLVHRLLKNGVAEATGFRAYVLFTRAAMERLMLPQQQGAAEGAEAYEHLGSVATVSLDLRPRYEERRSLQRIVVGPEEADAVLEQDLPAPPVTVWEWLMEPARKELWMPGTRWTAAARPGGRTGVGARNHCAHGRSISTETVLTWEPFEWCTTRSGDGPNQLLFTFHLEPIAGGTHLRTTVLFKHGRLPRIITRAVCRLQVALLIRPAWNNLARAIAGVQQHQEEAPAAA